MTSRLAARLTPTRIAVVSLAVIVMAGLAYLRDPAWLARMEYGFRAWETGPDGTRYRWINGHASFFVPSDAADVVIPIRTTFGSPSDPPARVSIAIDDRKVDELLLDNEAWQMRRLHLPPAGNRRVRRIDVRVDRLRDGNRGAQIGEIAVVR